jgi:Ca2+/H+ antiporter, TMEM165/GDT1 family
MNLEKVVFAFTIILALTLNFGFFIGDIENPAHHHVYELYVAIFVNAVATILKFGDRSHMGAVLLATSLVAVIQLVAASGVWGYAMYIAHTGLTPTVMASIVSLAGGALIANTISVTLLVIETALLRR